MFYKKKLVVPKIIEYMNAIIISNSLHGRLKFPSAHTQCDENVTLRSCINNIEWLYKNRFGQCTNTNLL
jgi:hypothetical protein